MYVEDEDGGAKRSLRVFGDGLRGVDIAAVVG